MMRRSLLRCFVTALPLCALAVPALADQISGKSGSDKLPGVQGDYSIVTPAPEPMEAPDPNTFKVGDTDVSVSGSVSVEIGTGTSHMGGGQQPR